ncbi:hypothetical protein ABZY14_31480 [Streptomyces sp. NPDC006617]|uniref:hypothetical protein n=1 Tax=Streptomyces sp. NPDC006617 TaxID=3155354 RepID=UPI0033AD27F4
MSDQVTCLSLLSTRPGNHTSISPAQSASVIGGPPGVIPDASAGARYFLTVLRSTPSDAASALFERPAYQWT